MALTWKDLVTTLLAISVATFSYFFINGFHFPLVTGYRGAILVLLILGIGMCALSSVVPGATGPFITAAGVLGALSLILIIAGLVLGTKMLFLATAGVILALWAIATLRHMIGA